MTHLQDTTSEFIRNLRARLEATLPALAQIKSSRQLKKELTSIVAPLVEHYFNTSLQAANMIMTQNIARLTSVLKVPLKYTRTLINRIHGTSIFKGYYNQRYGKIFSRRQIDLLKRTILRGAYSKLPEAELQKKVLQVVRVTKRRAQLLARNEVQRLKEEANLIYSEQPEVREKYARKWNNRGDNIRPAHKAMAGKKDNGKKPGYFWSETIKKWIKGPGMSGIISFDINCKCYTTFVRI